MGTDTPIMKMGTETPGTDLPNQQYPESWGTEKSVRGVSVPGVWGGGYFIHYTHTHPNSLRKIMENLS